MYRGLLSIAAAVVILAGLAGCPQPTTPAPSTDSSLSSLSLNEAAISPDFSPATLDYSASVASSVTQVTLQAEATDPGATIVSGIGSHALVVGPNTIEVVVEAASGAQSTYTVTVARADPATGNDATLASLSLAEGALSPAFSPTTLDYTASLAFDDDSATVSASTTDASATILSGTGDHEVRTGQSTILVVVEAEDGVTTQTYSITVNRAFSAQRITDGAWYEVPADLMATGAHCVVYAEEGSGIGTTTAEAIADEFDTVIYDLIRTNFANESDVDSDGRLTLLLLDIVDGYSGSGGYIAGYFSPVQLFSRSTYSYSNERDMLFLDSNPATPGSSSFFRTVTHEMQHLVNFANTYLVDGTQQDLWINEGLSSGSEFLYAGEQVATRIAYYNADPYNTIAYGNNFFVWNGYWESQGYQLENYATVYLFFQWLQIHASNGTEVYKDILLSSERDYQTVVDAATLRIDSSLDTWQSLLGTWLQANLLGSSSGLQGYAGEVALTPHVLDAGGTSPLVLSPGEGLYVHTDGGSYAYPGGSGTDIVYQGVDAGTGDVDETGPDYVGDGIIAFNGNNDYGGDDEYAYVPSVRFPMLTPSLFTPADAAASPPAAGLPESYPVDVTFGPDGGFAPDAPPPAVGPRPLRPLLDRQR